MPKGHEMKLEFAESVKWEPDLAENPGRDMALADDDDFLFHDKMPRTPHWSVPWSDLMMTMFILFAVLFAYHSSKREALSIEKSAPVVHPVVKTEALSNILDRESNPTPDMSTLYERSKQTLESEDLKDIASVDLVEDRAVRIILTGDVLFDTGKSELKGDAVALLKKVARNLRETPYTVNVAGHTDDVPINTEEFPSNWELSTNRACVTARFLIDEMDIPPAQIFVTGHAEYQPLLANNDRPSRAANRRVEIIITPKRPCGTRNPL